MRKELGLLVVTVALAGCRYGPASPASCNARYVRDHPNDVKYDACMANYRRAAGLQTEEEREADRERASRPNGFHRFAAAVVAASQPRPVYVPVIVEPVVVSPTPAFTPATPVLPPAAPPIQCQHWDCLTLGGHTTCSCLD
jgi:hypothetical protein